MSAELPPRSRGPLRAGAGLVVLDEARQREDAATFMRSQRLLQAGQGAAAREVLSGLATSPTTTVRAHAASVLAALRVADGDAAGAIDLLSSIPVHGVVVDRAFMALVRAQALRHLGRHDEAVVAAREAWTAGPSTERALVLTAALVAAGAPGEAAEALRQALQIAPREPGLLGQLAGVLSLAGALDEADGVLQELEALDATSDPEWHRQRAWAAACRGRTADAERALAVALTLDEAGTRLWWADDPLLAERGVRLPC